MHPAAASTAYRRRAAAGRTTTTRPLGVSQPFHLPLAIAQRGDVVHALRACANATASRPAIARDGGMAGQVNSWPGAGCGLSGIGGGS